MRILLLGATGRTGKWLVNSALEHGYSLNCLVRSAEGIISHPQIQIFEGSPLDKDLLRRSLEDCNAIVSALNISRTSDFPWAKLRTPPTLLSEVMTLLVELISETPAKRLVVCSAWGVAETKKELPGWFRWVIDHSNVGAAYKDHERQEQIIRNSQFDWTIVRPSGLTNAKGLKEIKISYDNSPKPNLTINRQSVAQFMIDALSNDELIGKCPVISS